ncbi:uncharacterized protein METZ01_LOCUS264010, partial [marine metagenome]
HSNRYPKAKQDGEFRPKHRPSPLEELWNPRHGYVP